MGLFAGTQWDRPPECEQCGQLESECVCPPPERVFTLPEKQTAKLSVEKRRKGKMVTVVRNLIDEETHLPDLLTKLKTVCGAGGTLKDGEIEIQGRQLERVRETLDRLGYKTKG